MRAGELEWPAMPEPVFCYQSAVLELVQCRRRGGQLVRSGRALFLGAWWSKLSAPNRGNWADREWFVRKLLTEHAEMLAEGAKGTERGGRTGARSEGQVEKTRNWSATGEADCDSCVPVRRWWKVQRADQASCLATGL